MAYSTDSTDFLLFNHQQPKSSAVSTSAKKVTPLLRTASPPRYPNTKDRQQKGPGFVGGPRKMALMAYW